MTPEQFVCWLGGFLKGTKFGNEKLPLTPLLEEVEQELAKVYFGNQTDINNLNIDI